MSNTIKRYTCRKCKRILECTSGWYETHGDKWCVYCIVGDNAFSSVFRTIGKAFLHEHCQNDEYDSSNEEKNDEDVETKGQSKLDVTICIEEIVKILKVAFPKIDEDVIAMIVEECKDDVDKVQATLSGMVDAIPIEHDNKNNNDEEKNDVTCQGDDNETTLRNATQSVVNMLKVMYQWCDVQVIELVVQECKCNFDQAVLTLNNMGFQTVQPVNVNNAHANYGYINHQQNNFQSAMNYNGSNMSPPKYKSTPQYTNQNVGGWETNKMYLGIVYDFNTDKRFGHIAVHNDQVIWVHFDDINGFNTIEEVQGSEVEFEAALNPRRKDGSWKAIKVWLKGKRSQTSNYYK